LITVCYYLPRLTVWTHGAFVTYVCDPVTYNVAHPTTLPHTTLHWYVCARFPLHPTPPATTPSGWTLPIYIYCGPVNAAHRNWQPRSDCRFAVNADYSDVRLFRFVRFLVILPPTTTPLPHSPPTTPTLVVEFYRDYTVMQTVTGLVYYDITHVLILRVVIIATHPELPTTRLPANDVHRANHSLYVD